MIGYECYNIINEDEKESDCKGFEAKMKKEEIILKPCVNNICGKSYNLL